MGEDRIDYFAGIDAVFLEHLSVLYLPFSPTAQNSKSTRCIILIQTICYCENLRSPLK